VSYPVSNHAWAVGDSVLLKDDDPLVPGIGLTYFACTDVRDYHVRNTTMAWTTDFEFKNKGYYVQEMIPPFTTFFTVSGFIKGAGTSLHQHAYEWTDSSAAEGQAYYYRLEYVDSTKTARYSTEILSLWLPLSVREKISIGDYQLFQNYPNPFNPTTTIHYELPTESFVRLSVFNLLGQQVRTLVNKTETAGYKSVQFDGSNLASGLYFYCVSAGTFTDVKKMLLVR
jgi:hypothetical protein